MNTDTSREAVERLRVRLLSVPLYHGHGEKADIPEEVADALVALLARAEAAERERDEVREAIAEYREIDPALPLMRMVEDLMGAHETERACRQLADAAGYARGLREAAAICDQMRRDFGSTQYAINQPMSSFGERFACGSVKEAILALLPKETPDDE